MSDFDTWMAKHYPMFDPIEDDTEEGKTCTRLVRCVASDLFNQFSGAAQLLVRARKHLPLAAASWNEDENRDVAEYHAKDVLALISEIDQFTEKSSA